MNHFYLQLYQLAHIWLTNLYTYNLDNLFDLELLLLPLKLLVMHQHMMTYLSKLSAHVVQFDMPNIQQ